MTRHPGNLAGLGPMGLKQPKVADPGYLAKVRALPCVICVEWGLPQTTPTEAHHVIHNRYGQRKSPDNMAIPLCVDCHRNGGGGRVAIHREPQKWRRLYGPDHSYSARVRDMIEGDAE